VIHGNGIPDQLFAAEASLAAVVEEPGADSDQLASAPGILSLIANRAAFEEMAQGRPRNSGLREKGGAECRASEKSQFST